MFTGDLHLSEHGCQQKIITNLQIANTTEKYCFDQNISRNFIFADQIININNT